MQADRSGDGWASRTLRPRVDTYETDEAALLVIEMPGVPRDGLEVTVEDDLLTVRGQLELETPEGFKPGRAEFEPGTYAQSFRLGEELDRERIEAALEHGLLRVTLPRKRPSRRSIEIRTQDE
jgi:HSP20 family molecular chaperone IbpA